MRLSLTSLHSWGDCGCLSLDIRGRRCDRSVQRSVKVSWIRRSPSKTDHEAVAASVTTVVKGDEKLGPGAEQDRTKLMR